MIAPQVMAQALRAPNVGGSDQQTTMSYNLPPRQQAAPQAPGQAPVQPSPAQPPPMQTAPVGNQAPATPTNRELIDSVRGMSKGDEKWFGQLFSDPKNAGLAGQSNWSTTDPAQLRQNIGEGGLNPQNQQRLISALRMGRPGFQEAPPLQQQPGMNQGIRYGR